MTIDWKRNNKVALRNFTEGADFHDIVKVLLVRMLRRKHPDSNKVPIYTEHNVQSPNESYPDIWIQINGDIYVYELQEAISEKWTKEITQQYEDVNLIIVDLKKIRKELKKLLVYEDGEVDWLNELKRILEQENLII